nr:MAG TPA: hypothetical protein [Caudoviricetes sp.]
MSFSCIVVTQFTKYIEYFDLARYWHLSVSPFRENLM